MRKGWIVGMAAVVVMAIPAAVLASAGALSSKLDHQTAMWRTGAISTSSRAWQDVPGLSSIHVCALNQMSATVSVGLGGAAAGFRVQFDDGGNLQPGEAHFDPASGTTSFSFTFVGNAGTFEGSDQHVLDVQWRSPTGGTTTLNRGAVTLLYENGASC